MSLPLFLDRVADALLTAATSDDRTALIRMLEDVRITVTLGPTCSAAVNRPGVTVAATLLSRLYPTFTVRGDSTAGQVFVDEAVRVNPRVDIVREEVLVASSEPLLMLTADDTAPVSVGVSGWHVLLDRPAGEGNRVEPVSPLVSMIAATLGCGALFRSAFGSVLEQPRIAAEPATLNLVTLTPWRDDLPAPTADLDLGPLHLAGAGAIGQAVVLGLAAHTREHAARASITVIDPETVSLSNLQRYVLAGHDDALQNTNKVAQAIACLTAAGLEANGATGRWGDGPLSQPHRECVLVALDSAADRIQVAAGMHARVYNAYTGQDLGWSRHEQLGREPCLACLYWPTQRRPDRHDEIANALGIHPLRALSYLTLRVSVGLPLPHIVTVADLLAPGDAGEWMRRSLLDDLLALGRLTPEQRADWHLRDIDQLYRDGVCGGALLALGDAAQERTLVPLAHQSALAGLFLALELLLAADPALRSYRAAQIERRLDVMRPLPQVIPRPRLATVGCFCGDPDYLECD